MPTGILVTNRLCLYLLLLCLPLVTGAAEPERVRLQFHSPHSFLFAGFYAAKEQGYYRDAGLDVEFVAFDGATTPLTNVLGGQTQFATGDSSIVAEYLKGRPLVLLAGLLKRSPIAIAAQPHISSPRDLPGKRVKGLDEHIDNPSLKLMLEKSGVDPSSIIHAAPGRGVDDFIDNRVDAIVLSISDEVHELKQVDKQFRLLDPADYGAEYYDVNLYTSREQLEQNPDRTLRFRSASIHGWEYALGNLAETVLLIQNKYNSQGKTAQHLRFEAEQVSDALIPLTRSIGAIEERRLFRMGTDFIRLGMVPRDTKLDFRDLIFREPNRKLQLSTGEKRYLKGKTLITYCAAPDWLPQGKIQTGEFQGMSKDYMELLSDRLNTTLSLVPTETLSQSLEYIRSRKCDLFALATATPEGHGFMNFTEPYIRFPLAIATRMDTLYVPDLGKLLNEKVGVVVGYPFVEWLREQYPGISLVEVASLNEGMRKVDGGELFGVIDALGSIGDILQRDYQHRLKVSGLAKASWELSIGVRNDDAILLSIIRKALDSVTPETHQRMSRKWFSFAPEKPLNQAALYTGFTALTLFLGGFIYFLYLKAGYRKQLQSADRELQEKDRELKALSTRDKLTGLYNRMRLDRILAYESEVFKRYGRNFSVLLIGVDALKHINDGYGLREGDRVLQTTASLLGTGVRKTDRIGRWGGAEFMIVCINTDKEKALRLAEKLNQRVLSHDYHLTEQVTVSIGSAQISDHHMIEGLLAAAEKNLEEAKGNGRGYPVPGR